MTTLTNQEKALSRRLIDKALQQECGKFLGYVRRTLDKAEGTAHERYIDLYKMVNHFDKQIDSRFGNLSGGRYLDIVTNLYIDGIISDDDIAGYEEENLNYILKWKMLVDGRRGAASRKSAK